VREPGLGRSFGTIGDVFDDAVVESSWARKEVELLNLRRWTTRVELSTELLD
jgi:putative transposase